MNDKEKLAAALRALEQIRNLAKKYKNQSEVISMIESMADSSIYNLLQPQN